MRFRLWRRRLTISAPRMAVRSSLPWPVRWLAGAVVLGFSAALALWAFEFGKEIAGLDRHSAAELERLRTEVTGLRSALQEARAVADTAESVLLTERSAQAQLVQQVRQLEADNQALRNDLGFFERLLPATGQDGLTIRALQAEPVGGGQWRWQVLAVQAGRQAAPVEGTLEIVFAGSLAGKPWSQALSPQPATVRTYLRREGAVDLPAQAQVKSVTARILQGSAVRASQTTALQSGDRLRP